MLPKCVTSLINLEMIFLSKCFQKYFAGASKSRLLFTIIVLVKNDNTHRMMILYDFIKRKEQQNQQRKWSAKSFNPKLEKNQTTISLIIKWHNIFFSLYGPNSFIDEWHIRITLCPHSWRERVSTFRTFVWQIIHGLINVTQ